MTNTEPLDLDAIEARANASTSTPWQKTPEHDEDEQGFAVTGGGEPGSMPERLIAYTLDWPSSRRQAAADAEFIAHAREDVPALISEVRRLRIARNEARDEAGAAYAAGFHEGMRGRTQGGNR